MNEETELGELGEEDLPPAKEEEKEEVREAVVEAALGVNEFVRPTVAFDIARDSCS